MRRNAAILAGVIALSAAGCGEARDRELRWRIEFDPADLAMDTRLVDARIVEGGCTGGSLRYRAEIRPGGMVAMDPSTLPAGLYGFLADARDGSCVVVATGCAEVRLPAEDGLTVVTVLTASPTPTPACTAGCMDGMCPPPVSCDAGACRPEECNGLDDDGDSRVDETFDLLGDPSNCGSCGTVCSLPNAETETCAAGLCQVGMCSMGWGDCDGVAENGCEAQTDTVTNCGGCGMACTRTHATAACEMGACAIDTCDPGWGNCDDMDSTGCETDLRDPTHCGSCLTVCAAPDLLCGINAGGTIACLAACEGPAPTQCGMRCVDTTTDPAHCGGCDMPCALDHAAGRCEGGMCGIERCEAGFDDCDTMAVTGCEADLASDAAHCGMCTTMCMFPNAVPACTAASCTIGMCQAGFEDCNGMRDDGCEIDTNTDELNCGRCGNRCTGSRNCCAGVCNRTCM